MSRKRGFTTVLFGIFISVAVYGQPKADFSRFVVVGDSLSAGYQNSQLIESGQVHGYANVIATQAGVSLNLPLLPPPGYPQITIQQEYAVVTGLTPVPRLNTQQTLDVAVPGFTVAALNFLQPPCSPNLAMPIEVMAAEILNPNCSTNPGPTALAEAAALKPTTAILWVGSNDVLFSLLFGTNPTDVSTFSALYHLAATTMAAASKDLVVANIPDVTQTAYLRSVPQLAEFLNLPVPMVEAVFGLQPDDMVTPYAFAAIQAGLAPLPDSVPQGGPPIVMRASRLEEIRAAVKGYNDTIAKEAADNGYTVVDIHSLVKDLAAHGQVVGGQKLTTGFMGGFFSLDGVHPTNTGYAILANEFIKTMNRSLRAGIPPISIEQVSKTDPLIFPDGDHGKHTGHVSTGMADGLRTLGGR